MFFIIAPRGGLGATAFQFTVQYTVILTIKLSSILNLEFNISFDVNSVKFICCVLDPFDLTVPNTRRFLHYIDNILVQPVMCTNILICSIKS